MTNQVLQRAIILILPLLLFLQPFLLASSSGWAQQASISPPLRTYSLSLPADKFWIVVSEAVAETEFIIQNEDPFQFKMTAIGKEYEVRVGFSTKRERQHITIEVQQRLPGIFHFFVDIRVMEFWPTNNRWTPKPHEVDTTSTRMALAQRLNQKLKPHRQVINH